MRQWACIEKQQFPQFHRDVPPVSVVFFGQSHPKVLEILVAALG
jgi:hypothetical protein